MAGKELPETVARALVIEFAGYHCATASTLEEAAQLLKEELFDVVVADENLCDRGQKHIVRVLKRAGRGIAVIVLSADNGSSQEGLSLPCSPQDLSECVERLVGKVVRPRKWLQGFPQRKHPSRVILPRTNNVLYSGTIRQVVVR